MIRFRIPQAAAILRSSVPYHASLANGEWAFFSYPLLPNAPPGAVLTLTSFAGDADLYASFIDSRPGEGSMAHDTWMSECQHNENKPHIYYS